MPLMVAFPDSVIESKPDSLHWLSLNTDTLVVGTRTPIIYRLVEALVPERQSQKPAQY